MQRNFLGSTLLGLLLVMALSVIVPQRAHSEADSFSSSRLLAPALTATPTATPVSDVPPLEIVGQVQGYAASVSTRENLIYLGLGARLVILDRTDPANPEVVGQSQPLPAEVQGIALTGAYGFLALGDGGFAVVNVGDPAAPTIVATRHVGGYVSGIAVSGDSAYVAAGEAGLRVFHINNPAAPIDVSTYDTVGRVRGVAVSENYVYVAESATDPYVSNRGILRIVDVSTPSALEEVGSYVTQGEASGVALEGSHAYVAAGSSGLRIVDVSTPSAPQEVGVFDPEYSPTVVSVSVAEGYAYIGSTASYNNRLAIVNVSNWSAPTLTGELKTPALNIAVSEDHVYLAMGAPGLSVVDVSNRSQPAKVGSYDMPGAAFTAVLDGSHAYVADGGVHILDVSTPAFPSQLGFIETIGTVGEIIIRDDLAYIPDYNLGGGLRIVDVSNPTTPTQIGSRPELGGVRRLALTGDYLYLLGYSSTTVVKVSNPVSPTVVYSDSQGGQDIAIFGNHAYVARERQGLRILDISNPAKPVEVGYYDTPKSATSIIIEGGYAYVADRKGGLRVLDLSNPVAPHEVGFFDRGGSAVAVAIADGYAFLAEEEVRKDGIVIMESGLRVLNVTSPTAPTEVGFYNSPGYAVDITVGGGHVYLAEGWQGLLIFRQPADPAPPIGTATPSATPTLPPLELIGNFYGGPTRDVEVRGDYAYVGVGERLDVLDIRNPARPVLVGFSERLPYNVAGIALQNQYAFVSFQGENSGSGLSIIDVSQPAAPVQVGLYMKQENTSTYGVSSDVAVAGNYAYLAQGYAGVLILDISNPSAPFVRGVWGGVAYNLEVVGNYLYVAGGESGGFKIVDVSNPDDPTGVGTYNFSAGDVSVVGEYAYVTSSGTGSIQTLLTLDVSDPANPAQVSIKQLNGDLQAVHVVDGLLFVSSYNALRIFDVTDSAALRQVGSYGLNASDVAVAGTYLYAASGNDGLQVLDIADLAPLRETDQIAVGDAAQEVVVAGDYAYVVDAGIYQSSDHFVGQALHIVDVSNPLDIQQVGTFNTAPDGGEMGGLDIAVVGDYVYLADGLRGLRIVDVSNRTTPREVATYDESQRSVSAVTVSGPYAYVAHHGGLQILDVSNPAAPEEVGLFTPQGEWGWSVEKVVLSGNYLYVAAHGSGVRIFDVSNPQSPTEIGFFDFDGEYTSVLDVVVAGPYAYVATSHPGYWYVINVTNPAAPTQVTAYDEYGVSATGNHLAMVDHHLYLLSSNGFTIIDVSDPKQARNIRQYGAGDYIGLESFALNGRYIYTVENNSINPEQKSVLRVIDVGNLSTPAQVGSYQPPASLRSMDVVGDRVYLTDVAGSSYMPGNRLQIVSVADPANPVQVATDQNRAYGWGIEVVGDYTYLLGRYRYDGGLYVADLADLSNLEVLGAAPTSFVPQHVTVSGTYAYVSDYDRGLRIFDISNPRAPTEVTLYRFSHSTRVHEVVVLGDYAYVATADPGAFSSDPAQGGLYVLDVSDPLVPVEVGFLRTGGGRRDGGNDANLAIVGNYAYMAENIEHNNGGHVTFSGAVRVIDISDPTTPLLVGSYETQPVLGDIAAANGFVFVAESFIYDYEEQEYLFAGGIRVLDVRNPATPVNAGFYDVGEIRGSYASASGVTDIEIQRNRIYVTAEREGLLILTSRYLPEPEPIPSATVTRTRTPTATVTATHTRIASPALTATPTGTRTATPTATSTIAVSSTPTRTRTATPTATSTATGSSTPSPTATSPQTVTSTSTRTVSPTATQTVSPAGTASPSASSSPTATVSATIPTAGSGEYRVYLPLIQR